MVDAVRVQDVSVVGRLVAPDPKLERIFFSFNADFSAQAEVIFDMNSINQKDIFGGAVRALFMDNSSNPSEVEVYVQGTDQFFTVPAFAEGVFGVDANLNTIITFATDGGATDKVTITLYNYEKAPSVWYRYGSLNNQIPFSVQGTQPAGTDMDNPTTFNYPVLNAGVDNTGAMRRLLTDATGRLIIVGSGAGGQVFGPDADGVPPTQPPVLTAGFDGTNVQSISTDTSGRPRVRIEDGQDIALGATTDAAITNPATNGSLIAFVRGILTGINSLVTLFTRPPSSIITSVADSASNQVILASNAARKGATVFNNSTEILYLAVDNTAASLTSFTTAIQAQGYYEVPFGYTGEINGIWAANAAGAALVTEIS